MADSTVASDDGKRIDRKILNRRQGKYFLVEKPGYKKYNVAVKAGVYNQKAAARERRGRAGGAPGPGRPPKAAPKIIKKKIKDLTLQEKKARNLENKLKRDIKKRLEPNQAQITFMANQVNRPGSSTVLDFADYLKLGTKSVNPNYKVYKKARTQVKLKTINALNKLVAQNPFKKKKKTMGPQTRMGRERMDGDPIFKKIASLKK